MARFEDDDREPLVETGTMQDVFTTGIARIDELDGNARLLWYSRQLTQEGHWERRVVFPQVLAVQDFPDVMRMIAQFYAERGRPFGERH